MWPFRSGKNKAPDPLIIQPLPPDQANRLLAGSLAGNLRTLQQIFTNCIDVKYRELNIGQQQTPAVLVYIYELLEETALNENVIGSLTQIKHSPLVFPNPASLLEGIKKQFLETATIKDLPTYGELVNTVLNGNIVLILDGCTTALAMASKGFEARRVDEPKTEGVVRGPREGFTETLRTNVALLRRRIKSPQLKLEEFVLGRTTKTKVGIMYLAGTANPKLVQEVKSRLSRIDVDAILESAYVEELIEDQPFTLFPQIEHSERPDKVAAAVLEGRVAILTDGTPFVLLVPTVMFQYLQSSEDYYERYTYSILTRIVRFFFLNFSLLLPAVFIAITTYHQELLPTPLLISITAAHEGVPFPTFVEAILMEMIFEALREAGVRLPRPVGQTISIVGALVIGEAGVRAGIASSSMVIIVALTGISSFCIPAYSFSSAIRVLRFGMIILGSTLGLYGVLLGMLMMQAHLSSLRSFGVPYYAPLAPFNLQDAKDLFVRVPWWAMGTRPRLIGRQNRRRQKFFLKPGPPDNPGQ